MRTSSLLIVSLAVVALLAVCLALPGQALTQQQPAGPRPTATAATLPPDAAVPAPVGPDALPDLVVESIQLSQADPYVNIPVIAYITIKNVGNQDVQPGNNFFVDFYINPQTDDLGGLRGDVWWPVQGHLMDVGDTAVLTAQLTFTDTAAYNLWAQVDTAEYPGWPNGHVQESDEDNNILGPEYIRSRTHHTWVEKDHTDFFSNMASTLDVVPVSGTVGIITNTPGLIIDGDSALVLGIFDEPPKSTWGLAGTIPPAGMIDYNMMEPDTEVNVGQANDQRSASIHAARVAELAGQDLVVSVWEDGRNGPGYGRDVFLRWSKDSGDTWNPAGGDTRVNDESDNDQKHPSVAVAPDGRVVVAWQDNRNGDFDIYVQVFTYTGGTLVGCQQNGDCSTACDPQTEACNFRVDTDANARDQILPDVSVDSIGNFYLAWQDQRNFNDDIFAVRSYTSTLPCPNERDGLGFKPKPAASATDGLGGQRPNAVSLCWGDDTRIDDDPSTTKQASPSISALRGVKILAIEYIIIPPQFPGDPPDLVVTQILSEPTTYVVATWEDWREGDADIYLTYSADEGETFAIDERLNNDKPANTANGRDQLDPATALNQWMKSYTLSIETPYGTASGQAWLPVTTMHIAWQDFRHSTNAPLWNDDPDIYYMTLVVEPDENFPWPLTLKEEEQIQVNENDSRTWQTAPVWQGEPDVVASMSAQRLADSDGYNAFVAWADGRNYSPGDLDNLDIYFRLFSNVGSPAEFIGGNNLMLNDNARLHNFTPGVYDTYRRDMPPHARQHAPSIASTLVAQWPFVYGGYVYAAWDDDRMLDPFVDRNVYMARSNLVFGGHYRTYTAPPGAPPDTPGQNEVYASGAYLSSIYDSLSTQTTWYIVDWHAVTPGGTYITLQTRMGNTKQALLASAWYPNNEFPYPDDAISKGAPLLGYDAPGQHIVNSAGDYFPRARYIQYRVNFWSRDKAESDLEVELATPQLYDVILHYERWMVFLPLIQKVYSRP